MRLQDPEAAEQLQQCQSTIRGRNTKLKVFTDFHLSLCLPSVLSFPPPYYFFSPVKASLSLCHINTDTYFFSTFLLVFWLFGLFFFIFSCSPACFPRLSLSVFFSSSHCPTSLHPSPVCVSLSVSYSFTLSFLLF